jgi:hypothetical protein
VSATIGRQVGNQESGLLTRAVALKTPGEFPPQRERCATDQSAFFIVASVRSSAHAAFCGNGSGFSSLVSGR